MILYGKFILNTLQTVLSPTLLSRALNHFYFETLNFGRGLHFVICPAIWHFWILHLLPCKSPSITPFLLSLSIHDDLLWHSRCGLNFNWIQYFYDLETHLFLFSIFTIMVHLWFSLSLCILFDFVWFYSMIFLKNLDMIILWTSFLAACKSKPIQVQIAFSLANANSMGFVPWFYNDCVNDLVTLLYSLL